MKSPNHNRKSESTDNSGAGKTPSQRTPLSIRKKILFSTVALCSFFVATELLLTLFGVRPVLFDQDPYVGFSSRVPLFVEQTNTAGKAIMATAKNRLNYFNQQSFPRTKDRAAYRVFCMGGSTTHGRPYDNTTSFCGWLRELLPKADNSKQWQLINAGGISYASYRVAMLAEELVGYEPDLFIIYTGHNEFLERRTYSRVIKTPVALRGLGAVFSRTRIHAALRALVDTARNRRKNSQAARDMLPGEVKTLLDSSVGPQVYHRDDQFQKRVLEHYRYNLIRMINIAHSTGADVILVTPASNLRHCRPFKSESHKGLTQAQLKRRQELFDKAAEAQAANRPEESLRAIDEAIAIDQRYAELHFMRGQILWQLERYVDAKAAFVRARDEDVCPLRALPQIRDTVIDVAKQYRCGLVDFAALAEALASHDTPGEELFLDHVHPTIEGNLKLALAVLEVMQEREIVNLPDTWGDSTIASVKTNVESQLDRRNHGVALRNLAKVLGWAGKHAEAERTAARAIQMLEGDAETYNNLGIISRSQGRIEEAIEYFRKSIELEPDYPDAHGNLAEALNSLGLAVMSRGNLNEAIRYYRKALTISPDYAGPHYNLAIALRTLGKADEAMHHYREALRIKPDYAEAHNNLANILAETGNLEEATAHYRSALEAQPDYTEARANLAVVLRSQHKFDEAAELFHEPIPTRPNNPASKPQ